MNDGVQVSNSTKIIIVDDRGKEAIRIARSMRQFGRAKAYVLEVCACRVHSSSPSPAPSPQGV